jgi:hypothetical protein
MLHKEPVMTNSVPTLPPQHPANAQLAPDLTTTAPVPTKPDRDKDFHDALELIRSLATESSSNPRTQLLHIRDFIIDVLTTREKPDA